MIGILRSCHSILLFFFSFALIAQGDTTSVQCGDPPVEETYCYTVNDSQSWTYALSGPGSMKLVFDRGTIENSDFDELVIHDGPDASSPVLYQHSTATSNLGPPGSAINSTNGLFQSVDVISSSGFLHMTLNSDGAVQCITSVNYDPWEWRVFCIDCTIPEVQADVVQDCIAGEFSIELDIVSTGDGATVNVVHVLNGGTPVVQSGVGTGITTIGPFPFGSLVDVTVENTSDTLCNVNFFQLTNPATCPTIVPCGGQPLQETYCYGANEETTWHYAGDGPGSLRLYFDRGTIQSSSFDELRIFDGDDNTAPVLFEHDQTVTSNLGPAGSAINSTVGNYYEVDVFSSSGSIFMELISSSATQCSSLSTYDPFEWSVVCLDCTLPQAEFFVIEDCDLGEYTIDLDILSIGDGGPVTIEYSINGGAPSTTAPTGTGITTIGPFLMGSNVEVSVLHGNDDLCDLHLGEITDSGACPTIVPCGGAPLQEGYCYGANEFTTWHYEAGGAGSLRLYFNRGTIQTSSSDDLRIYDGLDNTGPILFEHTQTVTSNLGPVGSANLSTVGNYYAVDVFAATGTIYMELISNGTTHCSSSSVYDPFDWEVVCLDCSLPQAQYFIMEDCQQGEFEIDLNINSTGDGSNVTVEYTVNGGAPIQEPPVGTGTTTIGPFPIGSTVNVILRHESNSLCDLHLGDITDTGVCPTFVICGAPPLVETYCYGANEFTTWTYQAAGPGTLRLFFDRGTIQSSAFDELRIHDGTNSGDPLLFLHDQTVTSNLGPIGSAINSTVGNYYVVDVFASTGQIYMELITSSATQCSTTSTYDPWEWQVVCLDCSMPIATAEVVQDCANDEYSVEVDLTSLGSATMVTITNDQQIAPIDATAPGLYSVGPINSGTPVMITLIHDMDSLCNYHFDPIVNPICPEILCGSVVIEETHCYGPNEFTEWAYAIPEGDGQLRLVFQRGTIQSSSSDDLTIHDGPDANSPILFQHTNTVTSNLGPTGSAINNTLSSYYEIDVTASGTHIYMVLESNGSTQCTTSPTYDEWEWDVFCEGCAAPGVSYSVEPDCPSRSFQAIVSVDELSGPLGFQITDTTSGTTVTAATTGSVAFGPYDVDEAVVLQVTDLDVEGCVYLSEPLMHTSEDCVIESCGIDNYTYCYGNNEDRWYTFKADENVPVAISFLSGQMLPGDRIVIYDGASEVGSPVLYQGNNAGNLTGIQVSSMNTDRVLTLRIESNSDGCCDDGDVSIPLNWTVGCGVVGIDEHAGDTFKLYPNPTSGLLTIELSDRADELRVRVLDMSGRTVIERSENAITRTTLDLGSLQNGRYMIEVITPDRVGMQAVHLVH